MHLFGSAFRLALINSTVLKQHTRLSRGSLRFSLTSTRILIYHLELFITPNITLSRLAQYKSPLPVSRARNFTTAPLALRSSHLSQTTVEPSTMTSESSLSPPPPPETLESAVTVKTNMTNGNKRKAETTVKVSKRARKTAVKEEEVIEVEEVEAKPTGRTRKAKVTQKIVDAGAEKKNGVAEVKPKRAPRKKKDDNVSSTVLGQEDWYNRSLHTVPRQKY